MSGALTTERAEEMQRQLTGALLAIVRDSAVPVSERLTAAQELDRQLGYLLRPQPTQMPSSFPGNSL